MHFWSNTPSPLLYAHRGASRERPENTLEAFERALELGADVLELDVHCTRDGIFVVSHDATGERMAGVPRVIAECDWAEIATWDAGWGFEDESGAFPFRGRRVRFCRFEAALELCSLTALNVDVKCANHTQLKGLLASIRAAHAEQRVLLTSFSWSSVRSLSRLGYTGAIGMSRLDVARLLLAPEWSSRVAGFAGCRAQIPTKAGRMDLTRLDVIERCHRLGLGVDYWVINDADLALSLIERGADGVVTDDPAAIATVLRRSPKAAAWRARHAPSDDGG